MIKDDFFSSIFPNKTLDAKGAYFSNVVEKNNEKPASITDISQFQYKNILPIVYENQILGGICIYQVNQSSFLPVILKIIFAELKILMRILWLHSETKYLSVTDELTGLYNRRYFRQILEVEFARAKRCSSALSLGMLDIDHFKNINDTYGHQFGDKVLSDISGIIRKSLRKTDIVARYGGEEIIIVLPETTLSSAHIPLEKLRKMIEEHDFTHEGTTIHVTASMGLATYDLNVPNENELIKRADDVLYKAKHNGRNRIEIYAKTGETCKG
jgi:diguanylate cyclase (GGDEF)-like protein